jgi:deoxyribodipyrimidine photo-lyase
MDKEDHVNTSIVWFRKDLRLKDNPALFHSARSGPILPVYIWDETLPEQEEGASRWWLHESLLSLARSLSSTGSPLVFARGSTKEVLVHFAKRSNAQKIVWNELTEPWAKTFDLSLKKELLSTGLKVETYPPDLLSDPESMMGKNGPYRVFGQFWKRLRPALDPSAPFPAPERIFPPEFSVISEHLPEWGWNPSRPDWAKEMREKWIPGEEQAHMTLNTFLDERLQSYEKNRDRLDHEGYSMLSPFLHAGEITSRQIVRATLDKMHEHPGWQNDGEKFLSELGWREFSRYLLIHFPKMISEPFQPKFSSFPWKDNPEALLAWKSGKTGYPVIDATMRQLWAIGYIPNRSRMISASFLTKDLLISWKEGARWFRETLVDHDLANNTVSWQWVSGMGVDAAPYFRIYNPVLQGERYDPEGIAIRKWIPEIKGLPNQWIHRPWEAPEPLLKRAGIILGKTYPAPIVDHSYARQEALALFGALGGKGQKPELMA